MADKDDNQYKRLPVVLQTTAIKNFFEYTVDQLYSEANVETLNGFVGTPNWDGIRADGAYIEEPTATKQAYSLIPTVNTVSPETGNPQDLIYYDEVTDILQTYGVDVRNQNKLFDAPYFTFSPPINEDKLVNFGEYYWAPPGANVTPNAIIITGNVSVPVDVEEDILGQQYYVYQGNTSNTTFRNGMVITFEGQYVIPQTPYVGNTFVVEGVGESINLIPQDRSSTAPYDSNIEPSYVVIERGATNNNGWSRNNYWFHKNNWYDAGQVPPDRIYRAQRPIIEFDRRLETYNQGNVFLQSVNIAVTGYNYDQVNGLPANVDIDGVNPANKTMIFPSESPDRAPYVYLGVPFDGETIAFAYNTPDPIRDATLQVEIAGEPGEGFIDKVLITDPGSGYTPDGVQLLVFAPGPVERDAQLQGTVKKGVMVGTTSIQINDPGFGYQSNTIALAFTSDTPNGTEVEPVAKVFLTPDGSISSIDIITRGDNYEFDANVSVTVLGANAAPANVEIVEYDSYLASVEITDPGEGYTQYQSIVLEPVANVSVGESVLILEGNTQKGNEYYYTEQGWVLADTKRTPNDPPLFVIYDDTGTRMDDDGKYPQSDFAGNKIFSYATPEDIRDEDAANVAITLEQDPVLGFPLVYRPFKAASEIVFTNNLEHDKYTYTPIGSEDSLNILGYNFYHLLPDGTDAKDDYFPYWKPSDRPYNQAIISRYQLSQIEIDRNIRNFFIGCIPNPNPYNYSSVDVKMYLNGKQVKGFTMLDSAEGYISVDDNITFTAGDYVEIVAYSDTGLLSMQSASKYEVPLGWDRNIFKENIRFTSEPEYLEHFKTQIESQVGFVGEPLGQNNYQSTAQDTSYATEIVQSESDVILSAYLLDDQPHNLIDAMRFNAGEYSKYKARLLKCINEYYATKAIDENNIDRTLELILREVIAFRVGKNVFNRTYVVPFGDNFITEQTTIGGTTNEITLDSYLDLSLIEHSLLVFATKQGSLFTDMLVVDRDYVIEDYNPIRIRLLGDNNLGSTITTKLYTAERDSAQCPPTPSVLGMYPLYQPEITMDDTFETPQEVIIGHDGSRTPTYGDARDQLLLDFEQRIYNAAKKEFREANSLPELNFFDIRPGKFRQTGFSYIEWYNLMRYYFSTWTGVNKVDPILNEFYDVNNPWTWNFRGTSDTYPGHWRGLYEYYYDTVRPHTHPWEMLGFTEKPLWWDDQYGTDYGSGNDAMWNDLEFGIIRQGPRENITQDQWKLDTNPYARTELFKYLPVDANGDLIPPNELPSGTVTEDIEYETINGDTTTYPIFYETFVAPNGWIYPGVNLSWSDSNVYIQSDGVLNYEPPPGRYEPESFSVNLPNDITPGPSKMPEGDSLKTGGLVGVAVNGIPIINTQSGRTFDDQGLWHYNTVEDGGYDYENPGKYNENGGYQYYIIPPQMLGVAQFDPNQHSPVIGWSLDGIPIYGPYGYTSYNTDGSIQDNLIVNIKSPWELREISGGRPGPGGAPTGQFTEDYVLNLGKINFPGYACTGLGPAGSENYAMRYGVTPESPNTPILFYVQCQDDDGNPMFPYACGGGVKEHPEPFPVGSKYVYANQFFGTPNDFGGISEILITDCGYDYSATAVVVVNGDGQGVKSYPIMESGVIRNLVVVNQGKNYAWDTTTIEILGDGTGATCEPIIIDGKIIDVKMTNFGTGYTFASAIIKQVPLQDGTSPGTLAELTIPSAADDPANGIVNDAVTSVVVTNKGYGYTQATVDIQAAVSPSPPVPLPGMGFGGEAIAVIELKNNNSTGNGYVDPDATPIAGTTPIEILKPNTALLGASWRYSDGAPVENAWKYSESYPFAVAEGLLLGQPAQFATQFADPTKLFRAEVDSRQQLCTVTRERWQFTDPAQFRIHGERDSEGKFLTNIGYTQFINSWLAFQGLDTNIEFAPQLRTINMRLSQRMSGYVDKDTMTVRTDQYSATGTTPSLIIPQDNINIQVHSSPYKTRNFYTGVIIEKAVGGYKVRGYDRTIGTFPVLKIDKNSPSRGIKVGGEPAPYSAWERNKFYKKLAIVEYRGVFYQAPRNLTTGADFDSRLWDRLPSLPQINGAAAEVWDRYLNQVDFVPYETLLTTPQEIVDLLLGLGAWQTKAGYDFDGFDYNTGDSLNWEHAAKNFLFWTTGKWEIGNTIELSPMATGATFKAPRGFIAKLNRIDRNQFTLLDADGSAITPESCEIVRLDDYIQVKPPQGSQIYGMLVFVKEIEHAMTLDNRTDFNDVIYDPVLHQYQTRVKIKGKRTAGWDGKFTSEGFIILDDELKPNLDNLAQSMGRYHELGFIPVEKQVYESARALFGYQSRDYMRDLDILDDQQFDFYKGFLQSKGTQTSLTRIGEANSIVIDGEIKVYDEWAVKVGDFGDVESEQAIEFKLDRSNVTSDPQLVTLVFPEDVTGIVERIDVINRNNSYNSVPAVQISPPVVANGLPAPGGRQATAQAHIRSDGKLDYIEMTDKGRGYEFATATIVAQGDNNSTSGTDIEFTQAVAQGGLSQQAWSEQPINGNCYINIQGVTLKFSELTVESNTSPCNVTLFTTGDEYNFVVGDTIEFSGLTETVCKDNGNSCANLAVLNGQHTITTSEETISGVTIGFTVPGEVGNVNTYGVNINYQSDTRYKFEFANVYYHEANIDTTPTLWGGKEIEDIFNAETANTGVTASMYASHVPNSRQPGQSGEQIIDWYTLVLRSDSEFSLEQEEPTRVWTDQFHIGLGTYTNQQRWAIDVASGTEAEDITVIVNGQIIDQCKYQEVNPDGTFTGNCDVYNWQYLPGGTYEGTANVSNPNQPTLVFGAGALFPSGTLYNTFNPYTSDPYAPLPMYDDNTTSVLVNGDYPFLDLMIGNVIVSPTKTVFEVVSNVSTPVTKTVWEAFDGLTQITLYPEMLPESLLDENGEIKLDLPTKLVEKASIKFSDEFSGDIYGSNISINVTTDDDLLCKIGRERTYEITKDIANDDIIVIDVDDPSRFLKKPVGKMTKQLWPEYTDVNYLGVKDSKDYPTIPNSGYVNSANVNFQAYDIGSLPLLFDPSIKIQPTGGHTIHVASSENQDWNVYELKPTNADIQFVARSDDRVSLYTNYSLFNYIDGNMIGENDTGRYLDYYLTLRNADVSDNVVVWTNETIIQQAQSTISNLTAPRMIEARIRSIAPSENSLRRFVDYIPIGDDFYNNAELSASGLGQTQQRNIVTTITDVNIVPTAQVESLTDPNTEDTIVVNTDGVGTGAEFSVVWDTVQLSSGIWLSTANSITIVNGGNNYQVGDDVAFVPGNANVGVGLATVSSVSGVEQGTVRSNVITIGRIQNSTIQEGDAIRIITAGNYTTATVLQNDIDVDYDNRTITFNNVSNADEFVIQNTLNIRTQPTTNLEVARYTYTILDNSANAVTVTSTSLTSLENMSKIDPGSFGSTNELRTLNIYDLGDPNKPNDTDTYYTVFNVNTGTNGTTTLQIERPNTYFNYSNVTSEINNITIETAVQVTANVTANLFTTGENSILIEGYNGALSAMNGLWVVYNVATNPKDPTEDLITFNTIRTLPIGEFSPPPRAFKTDTSLNVNIMHLNKTRLVMNNVNDISVGDQIKVLGNVFSGTYNADNVLIEFDPSSNDNSFTTYVDIPAPYILDTDRSGNVLLGGLKITTTNPHGISPEYAAQNKRIGVHFAFPKAYNRFYNVTAVDPYNIYIDDVMTQSDETIDFYRYETTSLSRNDNIYVTTNDPLLSRTTAVYASNSSVIAPNKYSVNQGVITFMPEVLPESNAYVTINLIREINRSFDRYPVITTVDHNKIRLNGVNFTINSYNSPEAITENINRAASLMRGWLTPTGSGMQFSFPMVKDYRTPVFAPDGSLRPAHTINNYGPYIRDKNTLARIANDPDIDTGVLSISNPSELEQNKEFNPGAIKIGPTKGATYYDEDQKVWMIWLQEGPLDTQGDYYPLGVFYEDQNRKVLPKRPKSFKIVPSGHVDNGPVLDVVPGSYPVQRTNPNVPGQTQYDYDMQAIREYSFPPLWVTADGTEVIPQQLETIQDANREPGTVKLYRYRLKPSTQGYFEVYEMVELTNGEIIGIKVDSSQPPLTPHNFYITQSNYGNFFGLASNSINFDSRVSFSAEKVDLYPSYSGGSLNLGPVSPPSDIGKTLIPEPFAFRRSGRTRGNGSDSILNWQSLPLTEAKPVNSNGGVEFDVFNKPGFDSFNIWQPGMIPGVQNPPNSGSQTVGLPFGKGRGYYEVGDGNAPEMFQVVSTSDEMTGPYDYANVTLGWADPVHCPELTPRAIEAGACPDDPSSPVRNDYPNVATELGWSTPQPRFLYSKRFTLETKTTNDDAINIENDYANSSTYYNTQDVRYAGKSEDPDIDPPFIMGDYPKQSDTRFRPDEIFVACFWTEPYKYIDQIVGYGPDPQNAGTRRPIIKDYYGTITRCKYIRLTELPLDAVLVRPECDTGWGGADLATTAQNNINSNRTAMDLLSTPPDVPGGTSASQNSNLNTGAEFTGGVTPEDPNPNQGGAFDINNQQQLPAGYQSQDNNLIEPGEQLFASLPNPEANQAPGIGLDDLSQIQFNPNGSSNGVDNAGTNISNESLQQSSSIVYPTVTNQNESPSPVLNPPQVILPGKCDIVPAPVGQTLFVGGKCDSAPSTVLAFTAANNYYGIQLTGSQWQTLSQDTETQKYEWHDFGKVANKYGGASYAWIEMVVDFRDDTLTAGGITLVQNKYQFGKLPGGLSFDPRDPAQQIYVDQWWRTATVVPQMNSTTGNEDNMLLYGVDNFSGGPAGRASGDNISTVSRIGLSKQDGVDFQQFSVKPNQWSDINDSTDWLCNDEIIGGSQGGLASHNAIKGAFGFNGKVDCDQGEYLTAFVHIGHGSGNNGQVIPRYDMYIRYNHNVTGYGGSDGTIIDACGDGSRPQSAIYAGGAHAKAYKSKTTTSTDTAYKDAASMKAGNTGAIEWGNGTGKDDTDLLAEGTLNSWLFDNIYFPYQGPVRQGEPADSSGIDNSNNYSVICCNPALSELPGLSYESQECINYRNNGGCSGSTGGGEFGGGPGTDGGNENLK